MDGGGVGHRAWECERKKEKEKFHIHGWVPVVDMCGWWPFRCMVVVVAVYTADVEEERKKGKGKDLLVGVGG